MGQLLKNLKPYGKQIALVLVLLLAQAVSNLYLPDLNAQIINFGVARGDTAYILQRGAVMLVVALVSMACAFGSAYMSARVAMSFGRDLRSLVFRKVESFSQYEMNLFGMPTLITRSTNDAQQVQQLVAIGMSMMVLAPINCIGGIIMALNQDVPLSSVIAFAIPMMVILIFVLLKKAMPLFTSMQTKIDRVNQVVREKLSGVRVIRAFVKSKYEEERFDEANKDLMATTLKVQRMMAVMFPVVTLIMNLSSIALIWFGAFRVDSGAMPIGNLTALQSYVMQILMSIMMGMMMFVLLPRSMASAKRITEVLNTELSIKDEGSRAGIPAVHGRVEFQNVSFKYPGAEDDVLRDVSFEANPGETVAVIGSTGSGKSTLINLIPRFYDVGEGCVLVDGVDVRAYPEEQLQALIGFVPQKATLFSGTVADNLRYGKQDASDEELWHALETAQAAPFVRELEEGLGARVAQGGTNFSGGQKQRLSIARALVRRPEIYIFDDSFSALDFQTDAKLRSALAPETRDACVIIIGQRVSSIRSADRIVVLDDGAVAGVGTHEGLLETCKVYQEILESQMAREATA